MRLLLNIFRQKNFVTYVYLGDLISTAFIYDGYWVIILCRCNAQTLLIVMKLT